MMPLPEIDRLKRTVTPAWDSPVADQVAAARGYPAGIARWWRSSASRVFVLPDPHGKRYLRFVPDDYRGARAVAAVNAGRAALRADLTVMAQSHRELAVAVADPLELVPRSAP